MHTFCFYSDREEISVQSDFHSEKTVSHFHVSHLMFMKSMMKKRRIILKINPFDFFVFFYSKKNPEKLKEEPSWLRIKPAALAFDLYLSLSHLRFLSVFHFLRVVLSLEYVFSFTQFT